jgi:hypothetical protein
MRHRLFPGHAPPRSRPASARLVAGRYLLPSTGRTGPAPLDQCGNVCSTITTITVAGSLPLTVKRRLKSASTLILARPFTRKVSFTPGAKKISPIHGSSTQISETINHVATAVWDEQRPTVIRHLHEPRRVALRRTVETFSAPLRMCRPMKRAAVAKLWRGWVPTRAAIRVGVDQDQ